MAFGLDRYDLYMYCTIYSTHYNGINMPGFYSEMKYDNSNVKREHVPFHSKISSITISMNSNSNSKTNPNKIWYLDKSSQTTTCNPSKQLSKIDRLPVQKQNPHGRHAPNPTPTPTSDPTWNLKKKANQQPEAKRSPKHPFYLNLGRLRAKSFLFLFLRGLIRWARV